ncbi:MAG: glycosyltransferase family 2 protein [Sulfitobacter sp.]
MRLTLLIGPTEQAAGRFRVMLKEKANALAKLGVAAPDWNHVRLYAACANPDAVGVLRFKRGLDGPLVQRTLMREFEALLTKDLPEIKADHIVVAAAQLGNLLNTKEELYRLKTLLSPHFDEIRIVAHLDEQARLLSAHYNYAIHEGRRASLGQEIALTSGKNWWDSALSAATETDPNFGLFDDVQIPPFWLDYARLMAHWAAVFGSDNITFRPLAIADLLSDRGSDELSQTLGLSGPLGKVRPGRAPDPEPAANLTRMRQFNEVLIKYLQVHDMLCPRDLWQQMLGALRIAGPPLAAGTLCAVSEYFENDNTALIKRFPDLEAALTPDRKLEAWTEDDPELGFRATQYLAAFSYALHKHCTPLADKRREETMAKASSQKFENLLKKEKGNNNKKLLDQIKVNHQMILSSQFRPHNNLGAVNEEELGAPYTAVPLRPLKSGSSGNVIVGCMKNEAPYIIEWIAYHRAIGVDSFLIYTNGCDDTTDQILGRLQEMGIVQHRSNEDWKGKSPQQHALNNSLKEPVIRNAEWIAHIDVDEFMNIRTGNGTLDDLFAAVPDATNIAMTWRLFGHNDVTAISDDFVIEQFDTCAPKYCPKPHTVWGYKTMFRNIGAYAKISCHRPNKLAERFESKVKWVNGSGRDMTRDAMHNGWRSSKSNVGYDLLQLNHYALRSAESFLIKRQRGRALHVDRSIGINYWIRMDWCDFRDITIKRNVPRVRAEYDNLMQDGALRTFHSEGLAWHKAKAAELRGMDEFSDLYTQALSVKLNETERVAYALSLDMES